MKDQTNSREIILERSLDLFYQKGYDGVGVAEIVQAAGITKPTLYYFFGSKEGLFKALLEANCAVLLNSLSAAAVYEAQPAHYHRDVFPVLKRTALSYFSFAQRSAEFYRLFLSLSFSPPEAVQTKLALPFLAAQYQIITSLFASFASAHGNIAGKEEQLSRQFVAAVNAEIVFRQFGAAELTEQAAEQLVKSFMHGIFS